MIDSTRLYATSENDDGHLLVYRRWSEVAKVVQQQQLAEDEAAKEINTTSATYAALSGEHQKAALAQKKVSDQALELAKGNPNTMPHGFEGHGLVQEIPDIDITELGWAHGAKCDNPSAMQQDSDHLYIACNMRGVPHSQWVSAPGMRARGSVVIKVRKLSNMIVAAAALPAAEAGISSMVLVDGVSPATATSDPHANHSAAHLHVAVSPAALLNVTGIIEGNGGAWDPAWFLPTAKILRFRADTLVKTDTIGLR